MREEDPLPDGAGGLSRDDERIVLPGDRPRIALIRLGALGDCVYTFPLVSACKARLPNAEVTWIVEARNRDVPGLHPGVDAVSVVDTRRWRRDIRSGRLGQVAEEIRAIRRSWAAKPFDLVLDPQGSIKSGAIAWLTRAPARVGFARAACREGMNVLFTTHRVSAPADGHIVRKNLSLLAPLGIRVEHPAFGIRLSPEAKSRVSSLLQRAGIGSRDRVVGIHPGAGHARKRWDPDRYARVADALQEGGAARVILTAGPGEETLLQAVASQMRGVPVGLPPLPAEDLAALLSRCDLLVAGDTGPLHLAAALGCPTVAIYGPSDPIRVAPVGEGHRVLKKPCACGWEPGLYFNRRCPDAPCLGAITVEEVVAAARETLGRPESPRVAVLARPGQP